MKKTTAESLRGGADRVSGEGSEGGGNLVYALDFSVLHDALDAGYVIDVREGVPFDDDEVGEFAGGEGAEVFVEAVGAGGDAGGGFEGLPGLEAVFDLGAEVEVEAGGGDVEGGVGSGDDRASAAEVVGYGDLFILEVAVGGGEVHALGGFQGGFEAGVFPWGGDALAGIGGHAGVFGILGLGEGGGDGPHAGVDEELVDVGVGDCR